MCQNGIFYERADENALIALLEDFLGVGVGGPSPFAPMQGYIVKIVN